MRDAIGYLRVSTREQGRSGLGLAAQRFDIETFSKREHFSVISWHQDIQTGGGRDALLLRPGLAAALEEARAGQCPLLISRLDRLSRNVHFITGLMEHKVHFVVAAFGRDVDDFTLHIYASIAEHERKMIAERVKAAMTIAKKKGRKFGLQLRSKAWQRKVSAMGRAALVEAAHERAQAYRLYVEWALAQPGERGRRITFAQAAHRLNYRNIETPHGGTWRGHHLQRMARRLGISHPLTRIPAANAQVHIRSLWERNPDITASRVASELRMIHPISEGRIYNLLKECRREAARRSPVHRRVNWYLDDRTHMRIRIGELWRRHPDYTGKQVMAALKLGPEIRLKWVQFVLHTCWKAYSTPAQRRGRGRTFYNPWRSHSFPRMRLAADRTRRPP